MKTDPHLTIANHHLAPSSLSVAPVPAASYVRYDVCGTFRKSNKSAPPNQVIDECIFSAIADRDQMRIAFAEHGIQCLQAGGPIVRSRINMLAKSPIDDASARQAPNHFYDSGIFAEDFQQIGVIHFRSATALEVLYDDIAPPYPEIMQHIQVNPARRRKTKGLLIVGYSRPRSIAKGTVDLANAVSKSCELALDLRPGAGRQLKRSLQFGRRWCRSRCSGESSDGLEGGIAGVLLLPIPR